MSENLRNLADTRLRQRRNKRLATLGGTVVAVAAAVAAYWILHASRLVSTDNAYAAVEVATITPAVGGTVAEVKVKDTQTVRKGDLLVVIDPTDARLALAQAEAESSRAVRRVKGLIATDGSLGAQVLAREAESRRAAARLTLARADLERARTDLARRQALVASGSVSGDELTRAQNAFEAASALLAAADAETAQARANLEAAASARQASAALIADTTLDDHPDVLAARARLEQARVDLARTTLVAPVDGVVARRQVQVGQRVQVGMPLMAVVPVDEMHVDANFKEVQLERVRVGQPVRLHADLHGRNVTYKGVVEGFSGGSGAAFAAIPAQNATGNWIKVVQRLPVRIRLDPKELQAHPLKVGLSMSAEIDTRDGQH